MWYCGLENDLTHMVSGYFAIIHGFRKHLLATSLSLEHENTLVRDWIMDWIWEYVEYIFY